MPESRIQSFCLELTNHKWEDIKALDDANSKAEKYHNYIRQLYEKHFPEKCVFISNLDKNWMTPQLKQLLRQVQRERVKNGKEGKFKKLWANFRKLKRSNIKSFYKQCVEELKTTKPGQWYQMLKKLGGIDQMDKSKLEIESLEGLSDKECAEAIAQSIASVSQEYSKLDRTKLPAFVAAGRSEQVTIFPVMNQIKTIPHTGNIESLDRCGS